jgi:hypothetical protein
MFTSLSSLQPRQLELTTVYTTIVNPKIASKLVRALNSLDDLPLPHLKRIRRTKGNEGKYYI